MDKRTILFVLLTIVLFFIYTDLVMPLFVKPPTKITKTGTTTITPTGTSAVTPTATALVTTTSTAIAPVTTTPTAVVKPVVPEVAVNEPPLYADQVISNADITAVFTNKGAALKSLVLNNYGAPLHKEKHLTLLNAFQTDKYCFTLATAEEDLGIVNWIPLSAANNQTVAFRRQTRNGLVITKEFSLDPDKYLLKYRVTIANPQPITVTTAVTLTAFAGINPELPGHMDVKGLRAYQGSDGKWSVKEEIDINGLRGLAKDGKLKLLQRGNNIDQKDNVTWTGLTNKYFACVLIPVTDTPKADFVNYGFNLLADNVCFLAEMERRQAEGEQLTEAMKTELKNGMQNIVTSQGTDPFSLEPNQVLTYDFAAYIGPKSKQTLTQLEGKGLENLISYGFFHFISVILLWILMAFHSIFQNYGWSIIFLTILIKVVLFPLTRKGQISMYRMQQLQPKIKALQEKYKNDKQRLGLEQIKLWKENKVNPLGGCLPMLLQIPIFFGLYWMLYSFIELRQAPFMLWINDLSQPDRLGKLPFTILGATDLNLLPILMTVSWMVQSFTQPKSPDPQAQASQKLMLFMPLISLLLFYSFPSGLALYWFMQTLLSVVEQQIIKRVYLPKIT